MADEVLRVNHQRGLPTARSWRLREHPTLPSLYDGNTLVATYPVRSKPLAFIPRFHGAFNMTTSHLVLFCDELLS